MNFDGVDVNFLYIYIYQYYCLHFYVCVSFKGVMVPFNCVKLISTFNSKGLDVKTRLCQKKKREKKLTGFRPSPCFVIFLKHESSDFCSAA